MHKIEITPAPCIVCGRGNTSDQRDPVDFVDFERDINWNEPCIMCGDCIAQAAGLIGLPSEEVLEGLRQDVRDLKRENHEKDAEIDSMNRRAKKLGIKFEPVAS